MRVLHLCPGPEASSGLVAYGRLFRRALRAEGVEIIRFELPARRLNTTADVRRFVRGATRAAAGYDLVHAELGGVALREFYAVRALQRSALPVCLTLHDPPGAVWWPFHVNAVRQRRALAYAMRHGSGWLADRLERALLDRAAAVFVLTETGHDALREAHPRAAERFHTLEYPISVPASRAAPIGLEEPLMLGSFGYWYRGKGFETVVRAVAQLQAAGRHPTLRLWGDVSPTTGRRTGSAYRRTVLDLADALGVTGCLRVQGHLTEEDHLAAIRACHAIVLPYEPTGAAVALMSTSAAMHEALAAAVPVVGARVRALPETLHDGGNALLFDAGDADDLAAVLTRLHDDVALRARLREGAAKHAAALDPARAARAAIAVYARCAGGEPARAAIRGG